MTLTRRDFTRIALTIRLYREQSKNLENATMVIDELVNRLCVDFGQINGAFKPMLFRRACGIERPHTLDWLRNAKTEYPQE